MPHLKLTKPGFDQFTGPLLGAAFKNGVSEAISQTTCDTIAAAIGGVLVTETKDVDGKPVFTETPAGSHHRRTQPYVPHADWPRTADDAGAGPTNPSVVS